MKGIKKILLYFTPFLVVVLAWWLYPKWIYNDYIFGELIGEKKFVDELGPLGDVYGALNTLFSGLAFAGVILSIRLQSSELKETRNEMARQSKQFESQANALEKQVFENTLFQLISLNNEIVNTLSVNSNGVLPGVNFYQVKSSGRVVFKELFNVLKESLNSSSSSTKDIYKSFHDKFGDVLGHYFRNIYQIMNLIDRSVFSSHEKKYYSNLVRAQSSKFEIGILFYNCLSDLGCEKFKPLLEKYEFFEHIADDIKVNYKDMLEYDISVFGWSNRKRFKEHLLSRAEKVSKEPNKFTLKVYYDDISNPEEIKEFNLDDIRSGINRSDIIWLECF